MTRRALRISDSGFVLPLDFVTSTQAILARKSSGKSYLASVQAEELLDSGHQVIAIDPTGAWYGLRSAADGKSAGLSIAVLGGDHGDVPLEEHAGETVARAIVEQRFSAVIDLSLFRKGALRRFMTDFLETLYRLNREALHLFIDEADTVAPQRAMGDEARLLGAAQDIVRRGRIRGIGCTMITQRPQVISKDVLSQCEFLTTLRLSHPRDIEAVEEWVRVHAEEEQAVEMIRSLPSLPIGTAWIWSPPHGIFERVEIRRRRTFDSGATPKAGEWPRAPKVLAKVDVEKLGATIAETARRAKESDPKALKARVAELERELAAARAAPAKVQVVEMPVFGPEVVTAMRDLNGAIVRALASVDGARAARSASAPRPRTPPQRPPSSSSAPRRLGAAAGDADRLSGGERKILAALAQYPDGRSIRQVAILTGYASNGGGFRNYLSALRSRGLLEGGGERLRITEDGNAALGAFDPLPTGQALLEHWLAQVGRAEREILGALAAAYPNSLSAEAIAAATPSVYAPDGGGFRNALSKLRTLELVEGRGEMRMSEELA